MTEGMQRSLTSAVFFALLIALYPAQARAGKVALLLEEPYGQLGSMDPLGHAAIYLTGVCAETPVRLRRCEPGERGVVLSRYHKLDGYDWMAMPLLAYLYAVDDPQQIPPQADPGMEKRIRDKYRRAYLMRYVPDDPRREFPGGDWTQLLGESYDRKIYGFSLETSAEQDDALIAFLNHQRNRSRYNLAFNNCANFAENILNFYYPHSIHRNFIVDIGTMTPKQTAHSLQKYAKRHSDLEFTTFVIPQVPGTIHRSSPVHGVIESLVETKKYALPLALLHPVIAGSLLAVYFGEARFHPGAHTQTVFDPHKDPEPGITETAQDTPSKPAAKDSTLKEVALRP
jgi:hypothetical protein